MGIVVVSNPNSGRDRAGGRAHGRAHAPNSLSFFVGWLPGSYPLNFSLVLDFLFWKSERERERERERESELK